MNRIKRFVTRLLRDTFSEADKRELIDILTTLLQEKVDDLVEAGTPVETAIDRSIAEFGSAEDVLTAFPDKAALARDRRRRLRNAFLFSLFGYALVVGVAVFVNLWYRDATNGFLWSVVVAIVLLFWPGALYFVGRGMRK